MGYLYGIDVSRWQGNIDYTKVNPSCKYVFAKATEGTGWIDPNYQRNISGAKSAGMVTGAYHFFHPDLNPFLQADHFAEVFKRSPADFIILDVEKESNRPDKKAYSIAISNFIKRVEQLLGLRPIIYTSLYKWNFLTDRPQWAKSYPLWTADYGESNGVQFPLPWSDWTLWQFTASDQTMIGPKL